MKRCRRFISALLALLLLVAPASATWSIVIVDTATGEVAIGCATCLAGLDLEDFVPVVVPGVGGAAAQASVGNTVLRERIRNELLAGTPPAQILTILDNIDFFHEQRQYGIVDVSGAAATFTGSQTFAHASGVTGQVGSLVYSIQGNILTGSNVIADAKTAVDTTPGDLIAKLMAGMEAARVAGGDGRCSCSNSSPTGCGSPPASFTKSSHIAFMISSRPGDLDVPCNASGCAEGAYYMNLNVANQAVGAPDPVLTLQGLLTTFRNAQIGRPDHFLSTVTLDTTELPADGASIATARLDLQDWQGTPLGVGGATVTVTTAPTSTGAVTVGGVVDNNDGTYDVLLMPGTSPGAVELEFAVDDGMGAVRLSPNPTLLLTSPFGPCGDGAVNDDQGPPADILRVNGSSGTDAVVTAATSAPLTFSLDAPPGLPPGGPTPQFVLWARLGLPGPSGGLPLGGPGTLCFLPPGLPGADPATFTLANTWDPPAGVFPSHPAPWSVTAGGIPVPAEFSVQGLIVDDAPFELAVTNAVLLRAVNFPPPTITAVNPLSAPAGAAVTVTGTEFQQLLAIDVGGIAAAVSSVTPTSVTFVMPANVGCDTTLTLMNPDTQSATAPMNPAPVINNTTQDTGPAAGGASFFIIGSNMLGTTATIGGAPAMTLANTDIALVVRTPPGTPGVAAVIVSSAAGCTAMTTYTYQ